MQRQWQFLPDGINNLMRSCYGGSMQGGEDERLYQDTWETLPKANAKIGGCSWQTWNVWDPVVSRSLQIKKGVIFLKLVRESGTVLSVVEILSHKSAFSLLIQACYKPCLCIQNYWKVYLTYEKQFRTPFFE
jgi:hypothetical protein